jgi:hypothetical protein
MWPFDHGVRDTIERWLSWEHYTKRQRQEEIEQLERRARRAIREMDRQVELITGREQRESDAE